MTKIEIDIRNINLLEKLFGILDEIVLKYPGSKEFIEQKLSEILEDKSLVKIVGFPKKRMLKK